MICNERLTTVIPVRAGSRGIPRKNLARVGNDTLLERTIKLSQRCSFVDQTIVSTDDPEMNEIAGAYGVAAPDLRPAWLATDSALTVDVVNDLIESVPISTGYVLLLQVTTPLRTRADLHEFCTMFEEAGRDAEAIVSLTAHDAPHPDKIQMISENGWVSSYLGVESMVARQSLPQVYRLNGAFYLTHRDTLLDQRTFIPAKTLPFLLPPERSINLDSRIDLVVLEALLERGELTIEE